MLTKIKFRSTVFLTILLLSGAFANNIKYAQTGFQFLSVPADARTAALAEAVTSLERIPVHFANPDAMDFMEKTVDLSLSSNAWIAKIDHNNLRLAISPFGGRYGWLARLTGG
jgi:hypothetical protein